jgi:tetratricopeptide (TPR) repeat protein
MARASARSPAAWHKVLTRRNLILVCAAGAVAFGAIGWLVLGPVWAIPGIAAGPVVVIAGLAIVVALLTADAAEVLAQGRPDESLMQLRHEVRTARMMARIWPGQWRDALANRLIVQAYALRALQQDAPALRSAAEAVAILQELAVANPRKYERDLAYMLDRQSRLLAAAGHATDAIGATETAVVLYRNAAVSDPVGYLPVLAEALTRQATWLADINRDDEALSAAREATAIYWHRTPWPDLPPRAARAALLEGKLLCSQGNYHEAATVLVRGWHLATRQRQQPELADAIPVLKAAHQASPHAFEAVWRAETGPEPPDWVRQ